METKGRQKSEEKQYLFLEVDLTALGDLLTVKCKGGEVIKNDS